MDILFLSKKILLNDESELIHGGVLVTNDGKIRTILRSPEEVNTFMYNTEAEQIIDFEDKVLMPGLIDTNVHVCDPGNKDFEDFSTATKAAAAGGFTTIVDMPANTIPPTISLDNLKSKACTARGKLYIDVALWGGLVPNNVDELWPLVRNGVVGIKCCLHPTGDDLFPHVTEKDVDNALKKLKGTGTVLAFHAELEPTDPIAIDESQPKKYETFLKSRPSSMEVNAVEMIIKLAKKYDVRTHILNLSSAEAISLINEYRKEGGAISVETCPHYLSISSEEIEEARTEFKCIPPIREKSNQEKLWKALVNKEIDMLASDHSPSTPGLKCLTYGRGRGDFLKARSGIASLQFSLSAFWTHCQKYGLTIKDVYRLMCLNPAKMCGLDNLKGKIEAGYDADFCIWDPNEEFEVSPEIIYFKNKANPYMNQKLRGVVHATVVRGLHVFQKYEGFGQPLGKVILRKTTKKVVKFT